MSSIPWILLAGLFNLDTASRITTAALTVRGIFKKFNQNAWLHDASHPLHLSFSPLRREDGDYDVSLVSLPFSRSNKSNVVLFQRTGKFFRFYDVRGLNHSAENLNRDHTVTERDEERKYEEHMDFKSSGSSLNI